MNNTMHCLALRAGLLGALFTLGGAAQAAPSPAQLLADMQEALVPEQGQLSRVYINVTRQLEPQDSHSWNALVARQRFEDGPRTAITVLDPSPVQGSATLTAPREEDEELGLWLYTPKERRARQIAPLEVDRNFLMTDFSFADLALTARDFRDPELLGEQTIDGRQTWRVRAAPAENWYYSEIVTWIAADTHLPVRREYFDRAGRLWKVMTVRSALIDDVPTVLEITLEDVQTHSISTWQVRALSYADERLEERHLSPDGLGELADQPFWRAVGFTPQEDVVSAPQQ